MNCTTTTFTLAICLKHQLKLRSLDFVAYLLFCAGALATRNATYGAGTGAILLDDVFCNGSESSLLDCPHNGVGVHNCAHYKDAGVRCPGNV